MIGGTAAITRSNPCRHAMSAGHHSGVNRDNGPADSEDEDVGFLEGGTGMDQVYCFHGPAQRAKFGVDVDENGVETCQRCRRPVKESVMRAGVQAETPDLLIATVATLPGHRIVAYRGLVTAHATDQGRAVGLLPGGSWHTALDEIRRQAIACGANAVVGLQLQTGSGPRGEATVVFLMGTAVVAEPDTRAGLGE